MQYAVGQSKPKHTKVKMEKPHEIFFNCNEQRKPGGPVMLLHCQVSSLRVVLRRGPAKGKLLRFTDVSNVTVDRLHIDIHFLNPIKQLTERSDKNHPGKYHTYVV